MTVACPSCSAPVPDLDEVAAMLDRALNGHDDQPVAETAAERIVEAYRHLIVVTGEAAAQLRGYCSLACERNATAQSLAARAGEHFAAARRLTPRPMRAVSPKRGDE